MSKRVLGIVLAALALAGVASQSARADDMDLELSRLSKPGFTTDADGTRLADTGCALTKPDQLRLVRDPTKPDSPQALVADDTRWRQLITQLSPAIAPAVLAPVTTTGPAGFDVALETNVTGIAKGSRYWETGSEGHGALAVPTCDGENRFAQPALVSNRVHFSKGLPLGLTLGGTFGKLYDTSLFIVGVDLKIALIEGLRDLPVPDLAVRAAANTAVGDSQYSLTVISADVILSKGFVPGRVITLSPYLGGGILWTYATSDLIDLTPNIDAANCAAGTDPVCNEGGLGASAGDFGHDVTFADIKALRYRGFVGMHMRYKLFALAAEFMFDFAEPRKVDKDAGVSTPRQWTVNAAPSLSF